MSLLAKIRNWRMQLRDKSKRGSAAVEFALTLPIWATIVLGTGDGTYYLLTNEKCDRIAYSVTDIVTQYQTITNANLADITNAAAQLMQPFSFSPNGIVVVTSVYQSPGQNPTICWQYSNPAGQTAASRIGTSNGAANCSQGATATLPNGLTLNDNDNVIVSEVYYTFTPLFVNEKFFKSTNIYRTAVYKPRLSPLITPPT
jgi:Flp pilus assembly protein TadG